MTDDECRATMVLETEYVTYEQALLLKEKGFPQLFVETNYFYIKPGSHILGVDEKGRYYDGGRAKKRRYTIGDVVAQNGEMVILCPSQSLVQKWLREEKHISIDIMPGVDYDEKTGQYTLIGYRLFSVTNLNGHNIEDRPLYHNTGYICFSKYEDALSYAIDEVLKII